MPNEARLGINKSLIMTKIGRLREYQRYLRELQAASFEDFDGDFKVRGAVERYLQVSIESL